MYDHYKKSMDIFILFKISTYSYRNQQKIFGIIVDELWIPKIGTAEGDHQAMLVYKSVLYVDREPIHLMVLQNRPPRRSTYRPTFDRQ